MRHGANSVRDQSRQGCAAVARRAATFSLHVSGHRRISCIVRASPSYRIQGSEAGIEAWNNPPSFPECRTSWAVLSHPHHHPLSLAETGPSCRMRIAGVDPFCRSGLQLPAPKRPTGGHAKVWSHGEVLFWELRGIAFSGTPQASEGGPLARPTSQAPGECATRPQTPTRFVQDNT